MKPNPVPEPLSPAQRLARAVLLLLLLLSGSAWAQTYGTCTVGSTDANLGNASSLDLATQARQTTGTGGLACGALAAFSTSYMKVRVEASSFLLTGPTNQTIPFAILAQSNGQPINSGQEFDYTGFNLVNFFTGPGGSILMYFRTSPTPGLQHGDYRGTVTLRWFFSICSLGVGPVCLYSESPGFQRPSLFTTLNWGSGASAEITVLLVVDNDCAIDTPSLSFGTAPLVGSFDPITQTITIRCSAGAAYTVGMGNGNNFDGGWRRMRQGATGNYLRYELYKTAISSERWGSVGSERRSSATAEINPGVYDGATSQGYTYRGVIDPTQSTPPSGTYTDNIVVDVLF